TISARSKSATASFTTSSSRPWKPSRIRSKQPKNSRARESAMIDAGAGTAVGLRADIGHGFATRGHWRPPEIAFWLAVLATVFAVPSWHLILTEVAILGLFALSLDLLIGYAGIISLGHAAYFGFGAYVA